MGIRVYIRNTADKESKNEICLGKLYAYAESNENFRSVKYMLEHDCFLPDYWEYFLTYYKNHSDLTEHNECLSNMEYWDYGEIARFQNEEIFIFVMLFAVDWNTFWVDVYPNCNYHIRDILDCIIAQNRKYNNCTWEIRQGA